MRNLKKKKVYPEPCRRIGCLGLSADPPHLGHLEIARLLLKKKIVEEVWLIPCYRHPFGKPLASSKHRWQMTKLLEEPGVKTKEVEICRKGKSYTIDTVRILKEKYPDYQFFLVIGSDILKTCSFLNWKHWSELSFLVEFLVVERPGYKVKKLYPGFILVEGKISNISSTKIRERIRHGLPIEGLIPPKVKDYIQRHNLYKD